MENKNLTSNGPALRWMIKESNEAGLFFTPFSGERAKVYDNFKKQPVSYYLWMPLELFPFMNSSLMPHLRRRRSIPVGQRVHESVYTLGPEYYEKRLHEGLWNRQGKHVEQDEFDAIAKDIHQCVEGKGRWNNLIPDSKKIFMLQGVASSKDGRLAFQDVYESLKTVAAYHPDKRDTTLAKIKILCGVAGQCRFPKHHVDDIPPVVKELLSDPDTTIMNLAKSFLMEFSHAQSFKISFDAVINSLAISKGGSFDRRDDRPYYLAVASAQTAVPIHNLTARQSLRTLKGNTGHVQSVSFSPLKPDSDDLILVSGSMDGTIRVWDVASGSQWEGNEGHSGGTLSVSFSPDGQYVISGGCDASCKKWEVDSRDTRRLKGGPPYFAGHDKRVFSTTISPDGKTLVSVSNANTIRLWNCQTGEMIGNEISRQPDDPKEVIFLSKDYFLYASSDGTFTARKSDNKDEPLCGTIKLPRGVTLRSFGAYKHRLASGLSDGRIVAWTIKLEPGKQLEIHEEHTNDYHLEGVEPASVTSLVFTDDLQRLVAGYADGYVVVWYAGGVKDVIRDLPNGRSIGSGGEASRQRAQVVFHRPLMAHKPAADSMSGPEQTESCCCPVDSEGHLHGTM
ncbi:hypothetical protein AAF712_015814 [Marasmius tenuissimus]|uniref:WD40 repeat-like protein n=1 Tax=Marasmius tenuissimus TaxID=585030 RepID=A0ABR2Z9U4_9AGAR